MSENLGGSSEDTHLGDGSVLFAADPAVGGLVSFLVNLARIVLTTGVFQTVVGERPNGVAGAP